MEYHRTEHIAAGSYTAKKNVSDVYQAYLGTCLGIALYDRNTRIGGLIHILLPEPLSLTSCEFPEKYASTGIPLLLNELISLGAHPEDLEATIAGGALVGPVTRQDINLDIGGRSAEIAQTLLKKYGVKILKSETGGFFTCTLELNMATGQTTISPAWEDVANTTNDFIPPTINDIHETINSLKPIPQTALKIFRMFYEDNHDIEEMAMELSKDQVLSAQTLKICNSALFAGNIKIDTLKEAVLLLGQNLLIKSVITAAVNNYFNQSSISGYSLCKGGMFFHAVGTATTAEKIAELSKKSTPKHAYAAGLLHDIGKVVLDQFISKGSPLFFRNLKLEHETSLSSEKKILGINHCEVGSFLAKNWRFSTALKETILFHHTPEKATENKDLANIIYLADLLMDKFSTDLEHEKMNADRLSSVLEQLNMSMADLPGLVDAIPVKHQLLEL